MGENILVRSTGWLYFKKTYFKCAIGSAGLSKSKHEGDKATPFGTFELRHGLYRADRIQEPVSKIQFKRINKQDGWCDDPNDILYNKRVTAPYPASHERLWRRDRLYDVIVVVGYNDQPTIPNKGSAIFLHVADPNYKSTEGCIAISYENLIELLGEITTETLLTVC